MAMNRRNLLQLAGGASLVSAASAAAATDSSPPPLDSAPPSLPDKANFVFEGTHLNAAYTHPLGLRANASAQRYAESRLRDPGRNWPADNARDEAVRLYAALINAAPSDIAVVPSTLEGENLIGDALGLGPNAGVVTDAFHYDASLVRYGELAKGGMPLSVIAPQNNRIDYEALDRAIGPKTRLVAISLVASATGYRHDLARVCEIAHAKGALVYADVIQAVGAEPLDVKESGVDFCCAGLYKWLMGEFGAAFLYVRPDRLSELHRVQLGWRGVKSYKSHFMPYDPPGPAVGEWTLGVDTRSIFEVSTPNWGGLATMMGALTYIEQIGVAAIDAYRRPMLARLQDELPRHGFVALTPRDAQGPSVVFEYAGARDRFMQTLKREKIYLTLYKNSVRISPSVHNDMSDIERLIKIFATPA